ncbi:CPXCG motif-containing cysteine-rich protein [Tenacibaculum litopenaei]|uniref:CPXCG motif-containing cysteine-rich protein n=1 Tax=Tenacibaculum litopenaei TaxID=396016 RepID=UPI0038B67469
MVYEKVFRKNINGMLEEHFFQCPYCWEQISVLVDTSVQTQSYIEDCEVCCNPFRVQLAIEERQLVYFEVNSIEQ